MSKKKAPAKKKPSTKSAASKAVRAKRTVSTGQQTARPEFQPPAAKIHVYRHEVDSNPNNAPLVVDIPMAAGRGQSPASPSFVGFTAEMSEEHWPDQFAFRIISLDSTTVRVMISRIDKGSDGMSWGAKLVVHVLVVSDV